MILRTEGIVLRTFRMTDSSRIAVLYTRLLGKVRAVARGARKPRSKFGASLEPFTEGAYIVYHKEGRELQTLSEGDILRAFDDVKSDLDRVLQASAISELTDAVTAAEDPNPALYDALGTALACLGRLSPERSETALWFYEVRAAGALGYRPSFDRCVSCGKAWQRGRAGFSPRAGGLVCSRCQREPGSVIDLTESAVRGLGELQSAEAPDVPAVEIPEADRAHVRRALRLFVEYHTEGRRPLRSLSVGDQMRERPGSAPDPPVSGGSG
jgi:DNA repair protein RecO (recombination protein O)